MYWFLAHFLSKFTNTHTHPHSATTLKKNLLLVFIYEPRRICGASNGKRSFHIFYYILFIFFFSLFSTTKWKIVNIKVYCIVKMKMNPDKRRASNNVFPNKTQQHQKRRNMSWKMMCQLSVEQIYKKML